MQHSKSLTFHTTQGNLLQSVAFVTLTFPDKCHTLHYLSESFIAKRARGLGKKREKKKCLSKYWIVCFAKRTGVTL